MSALTEWEEDMVLRVLQVPGSNGEKLGLCIRRLVATLEEREAQLAEATALIEKFSVKDFPDMDEQDAHENAIAATARAEALEEAATLVEDADSPWEGDIDHGGCYSADILAKAIRALADTKEARPDHEDFLECDNPGCPTCPQNK